MMVCRLPTLECKNLWLEIVTEEVLKVCISLKRGGMGEDHKSVEKLTHNLIGLHFILFENLRNVIASRVGQ